MMDHYIIEEPSAAIRSNARKLLKGNWEMVVLGMFIYYLLLALVPVFLEVFVPIGVVSQQDSTAGVNVSYSMLASFYQIFLSGAFSAGLASFFLHFVRLRDVNPGYVFNGFEYYLRTLSLMILMATLIFLWSLLLIVPGIIAWFRYTQAFYILADDPRKSALQCLRESKQMMVGNKMKYFTLNLSYVGWLILSCVPLAVATGLAANQSDAVNFVIMVIGFIPVCVAAVYVQTGNTVFYEILSGHMRPANDPMVLAMRREGRGDELREVGAPEPSEAPNSTEAPEPSEAPNSIEAAEAPASSEAPEAPAASEEPKEAEPIVPNSEPAVVPNQSEAPEECAAPDEVATPEPSDTPVQPENSQE